MARKRISFTLAAVIVFFIILLSLVSIRLTGIGSNFPNPVGKILRQAIAPLQSGVTSVTTAIRDDFNSIRNFGQLSKENADLKTKVAELSQENNELKQKILAGLRYEEMANKFNAPNVWDEPTVGAVVIDRNPSNWYHTLVINRGTKNGVKVNDPVITNYGLVGKVISVTDNTSEVILILDPQGQVSGLVRQSDGTAAYGIVQGDYQEGTPDVQSTLKMTIPKDYQVNPGDLVLTSGMGGVYPENIPVGTVKEVSLEKGGLLKTAVIEPTVQFAHLEEVFVVLTPGGTK